MFCGRIEKEQPCSDCEQKNSALKRNSESPIEKRWHYLTCVDSSYAPYWYDLEVEQIVKDMKYSDKLHALDFCAESMAKNISENLALSKKYDVILSVPTIGTEHFGRENIPFLLAKKIAGQQGIAFSKTVLKKVRKTDRQSALDSIQRLENVKNAFLVTQKDTVKGKRILIVDDVLTTGATLNECARALKKAGAILCDTVCFAASPKYDGSGYIPSGDKKDKK